MKKALTILCFLLLNLLKAQSPTFQWARQVGNTNQDEINSVITDASGNVYYIGYFMGSVDLDPTAGTFSVVSKGAQDIFITKLDAAGNFLWTKTMGGTSSDYGVAIELDALGNIYYTGRYAGTCDFDPGVGTYTIQSVGNTQYDVIISKLDPSGNFLWAKSIGGSTADEGHSISRDGAGFIYVSGYFTGTADFDPGPGSYSLTATPGGLEDMFIVKLNTTTGAFSWAVKIGGTSIDEAFSIKSDNTGNVFVTGYFGSTVDFDPTPGTYTLATTGNYDCFVLKLDNLGNLVWVRTFGSTLNDLSRSIGLDALGNVYTTGYFQNTVDFDPGPAVANLTSAGGTDCYVLKLNPSGNFVWAKNVANGSGYEESRALSIDAFGNVYSTGIFDGTTDFDPSAASFNLNNTGFSDIYISIINSAGNFIWAGKTGSNSDDYATCIHVDGSYNIFAGGAFKGSSDFDPGAGSFMMNSANASTLDGYCLKLAQTGVGVNELADESKIMMYPNPAIDRIQVSLKTNEMVTLEIYNSLGALQLSQNIQRDTFIDIAELNSGIYFVKLKGDTKAIKLVKE